MKSRASPVLLVFAAGPHGAAAPMSFFAGGKDPSTIRNALMPPPGHLPQVTRGRRCDSESAYAPPPPRDILASTSSARRTSSFGPDGGRPAARGRREADFLGSPSAVGVDDGAAFANASASYQDAAEDGEGTDSNDPCGCSRGGLPDIYLLSAEHGEAAQLDADVNVREHGDCSAACTCVIAGAPRLSVQVRPGELARLPEDHARAGAFPPPAPRARSQEGVDLSGATTTAGFTRGLLGCHLGSP